MTFSERRGCVIMKVLWLCNIMLPKISEHLGQKPNIFGGWLTGLLNGLLTHKEVELSLCFPVTNRDIVITGETEGLKYYSFYCDGQAHKYSQKQENEFINILKQVNPDVVHIFGTEYPHALAMVNACEDLQTLDKVIVNIQGLATLCAKHYYASLPYRIVNSFTIRDIIKRDNIKQQKKKFEMRGKYEIKALQKVKHIIGRTDWDEAYTSQVNPKAKYHFCNEILRDSFYSSTSWRFENCEENSIFLSQANYPIKGFHYVLEAMAEIIKKHPKTHAYIAGDNVFQPKSVEQKLRMSAYHRYISKLVQRYNLQNNITFLGTLDEFQMCERFLKSHIFVSPSAIENSPNSLGEAMILGLPCVASDVGGVKNMITNDVEGFVYQHDAPYMLAHYICKLFEDNELARKNSKNARTHALKTHSRERNVNELLEIYKEIIRMDVLSVNR